jgi:hypothetical protein
MSKARQNPCYSQYYFAFPGLLTFTNFTVAKSGVNNGESEAYGTHTPGGNVFGRVFQMNVLVIKENMCAKRF